MTGKAIVSVCCGFIYALLFATSDYFTKEVVLEIISNNSGSNKLDIVLQALFLRTLFALSVSAIVALFYYYDLKFNIIFSKLAWLRGFIWAVTACGFALTFSEGKMVESYAIIFTFPLFVFVISSFVDKSFPSFAEVCLVFIMFCAAVSIPYLKANAAISGFTASSGMYLAFFTAAMYAIYMFVTKKFNNYTKNLMHDEVNDLELCSVTTLSVFAVGLLFFSLLILVLMIRNNVTTVVRIDNYQIIKLFICGGITVLAIISNSISSRYISAGAAASFTYLEVFGGVVSDYKNLNTLPNFSQSIAIGIIVLAALFMSYRITKKNNADAKRKVPDKPNAGSGSY